MADARRAIGWQSGDGIQLSSSTNVTYVTSSPTPYFGTYCAKITGTGDATYRAKAPNPPGGAFSALTGMAIFEWYGYFSDVTPSTRIKILGLIDVSSVVIGAVYLETDGDLAVEDANGTVVGSAAGGMSDNTWWHFKFAIEAASSGDAELFAAQAGSAVASKVSLTGEDFNFLLPGIHRASHDSPSGITWYLGQIYTAEEAVDASDGAITDDFFIDCFSIGSGSTEYGDAEDGGTWPNTGEVPPNDSNDVYYDPTNNEGYAECDGAARDGPADSGNYTDDAQLLMTEFVWRLKSATFGANNAKLIWGANAAGVDEAIVHNVSTSFGTLRGRLDNADTYQAGYADNIFLGFGSRAYKVNVAEMYAWVLRDDDASSAPDPGGVENMVNGL